MASASSLINSGVDVGIPFLETAPDLGAFEFDGISTSAKNISAKTNEFNLNQNFPNPFNLSTQINYSINKLSNIEISIYDVLGRRIKILFDGEKSAGEYRTFWNGIDENGDVVNSGVYFIILKSSEYSISRKIVLLK
ncbi:MAG: T9SS type A sorting domain-containing protein [Ignavibacteriales bacterium]|nr:T9SS type A sorting domain-containing protein [Ignavibacteriales bacterium]